MASLGKTVLIFALSKGEQEAEIRQDARDKGYTLIKGQVGSMSTEKIFAAVSTASQREGLISKGCYRDTHALYHAIQEAFIGICRGQLSLGNMLRTVGLVFTVVRGPRTINHQDDGDWLAVALYGTIGAPIKGFEHEAIGLGINHI